MAVGTAAADARSVIAADLARLQRAGAVTVAGEQICAERSVLAFYKRRQNEPAWDEASIASLLRAIRRSTDDGLNPGDYHLAAIESLPPGGERDLLASDAFLLLGLHLTQGRVDPVSLIPQWCIPPRRIDLAAGLQTALDAHDVEGMIDELAPHHPAYRRLREALALYRQIEASGGWPPVSPGIAMRLGDRGPRVIELRRRLAREPSAVPDLFDDDLEAAVKDFQAHHGLTADGIAGVATLRELNVSAGARIRQIEVNMERWRWMPENLGDSYALVNIAGFRLGLFENERSVMTMKTIVGKNFWETPFFPAKITEIILNPSWYVPENIADGELRPKQRRDSSYYAREHIQVMPGGSLRQLPGPWNSLGRIKFNMPNRFSVYLHDTPAKQLFSMQTRTFSHGCIRIERPLDLAVYLLRGDPEWNAEKLQTAIDAGVECTIRLKTPEPVYVLYWTAWAAEDGHIEFHRDVYNRDAALERALRSSSAMQH